jgi:hypothetical protein
LIPLASRRHREPALQALRTRRVDIRPATLDPIAADSAQPMESAMLSTRDVECPYCGEVITLALDASAGPQCYIEDCHVCCRPITVVVTTDGEGDVHARVQSEQDT